MMGLIATWNYSINMSCVQKKRKEKAMWHAFTPFYKAKRPKVLPRYVHVLPTPMPIKVLKNGWSMVATLLQHGLK
ncbi:unnamed protein product [Toxocara canis]|uniref:Transposase n=1 Tax=Toxocara canis TaxID=6265 RepID=A0A183UMT0_TOXCA|nr:unnamed protein product [Toxocara canis]